jgi:hypothetical protein
MRTRHGASPAASPLLPGPDNPELFHAKGQRRAVQTQADRRPLGARVALAADDLAQALVTIEDVEVPLAAWRVHATAAVLNECTGKSGEADHHRALSRTTILHLAQSLPAAAPLRHTFLSATAVVKVLGDAERMSRST